MELRSLRYFLAAAREGSITWAAHLLDVSQPTLSRQIKQLEEELGVTLFHRGAYTLTLTAEGRMLRDRARTIVALADKAQSDLHRSDTGLHGEISIGCAGMRGLSVLTRDMAAFRDRYPAVRFRVLDAGTDTVREWLDLGTLDFGVVPESSGNDRYDRLRTGPRERWVAAVPERHPLATHEHLEPTDLSGIPLVLPSLPSDHDAVRRWFGSLADRPSVIGFCTRVEQGLAMTAGGMGVFLHPDMGTRHPHVSMIPLTPYLETGSSLIWTARATLSPAATRFAGFIAQRTP